MESIQIPIDGGFPEDNIMSDLVIPPIDVPHLSLGERMKQIEQDSLLNPCIDPKHAWIVRLDGKNFSTFTRKFEKPFDIRFKTAMKRTLEAMMDYFHASTGFCCSDEITLIFPASEETLYQGRKMKIATVCAGKCSSFFNTFIRNECPLWTDYFNQQAPCFDARILEMENTAEICNHMIWRSLYDCKRNTISSWARHVLGTKACHKKDGKQLMAMMQEQGFNFYERILTEDIYGLYMKKQWFSFTNEKGEAYQRTHPFYFSCIMKCNEEWINFLLMNKISPTDKLPDELV